MLGVDYFFHIFTITFDSNSFLPSFYSYCIMFPIYLQLCLWSLVALIVPATSIGTACGIATFLLGTGVGLSNLGVGEILGSHKE